MTKRNPLSKDTQAYKNKLAYIHRIQKEQPKLTLLFNPNTEQDLIDWLALVGPKATYIKALIRNDMKEKRGN